MWLILGMVDINFGRDFYNPQHVPAVIRRLGQVKGQ